MLALQIHLSLSQRLFLPLLQVQHHRFLLGGERVHHAGEGPQQIRLGWKNRRRLPHGLSLRVERRRRNRLRLGGKLELG